MINALIGQKVNQAQSFLENGKRVPVTEIALTDNVVLQVKSMETDKYSAVQLGAGLKHRPIKAVVGHAKKAGVKQAPYKIKEVLLTDATAEDNPKAGDLVSVDAVFKPGDQVTVSGTSKGKGFAGGVKRHGFRGGPKTHGQSDRHRAPGSIGQGTTPGRVYKGKRMAGRMGSDTVTVSNLTVVDVDTDLKKLYVSGLIPGHKNAWVVITKTGENKKYVQLLSVKEAAEKAVDAEKAEVVEVEAPAEVADDVKDGTETVETPEETVKTVEENVETAVETVEAPAEVESSAIIDDNSEVKSDQAEPNVKEEKDA